MAKLLHYFFPNLASTAPFNNLTSSTFSSKTQPKYTAVAKPPAMANVSNLPSKWSSEKMA